MNRGLPVAAAVAIAAATAAVAVEAVMVAVAAKAVADATDKLAKSARCGERFFI